MSNPTCQNQQIVSELKGQAGKEKQFQAWEDLGRHLYVVALQYLWRRKNDVVYLSNLPHTAIESHAEDFVQEAMLKLAEDNFRRLEQYAGQGKFTAWVAQVVINCIRDELRCSSWHRRTSVVDYGSQFCDTNPTTNPERQSMSDAISERIHLHMAKLTPKRRAAITRCLVDGEPVVDVAEDMGLSVNALYIQLSRGKATLRKALAQEGFMPEG